MISFLNIYFFIMASSTIQNVSSCPDYINAFIKHNYDIADQYKRDALNYLFSLSINIENDINLTEKLKTSVNQLHTILNKYINDIILIYNKDLKQNGYYNDNEIIIYNEPQPFNKFDSNNIISHDFY